MILQPILAPILALALQATPAPAPPPATAPRPTPAQRPDAQMAAMIAIFESACLRTFPDDAKIATALEATGWTPLTPAEVKLYLRDDPGRGWRSPKMAVGYVLTLEAAPIRACALRTLTSNGLIDDARYAAAVDAAKARAGGGFVDIPAFDRTTADARIQATGAQKMTADGGAEAFYLIRTGPARPTARSGIEVRMVHQFVPARPK